MSERPLAAGCPRPGCGAHTAARRACCSGIDITPFAIDGTAEGSSSFNATLPESTAFWSCINTGGAPNFVASGTGNPWGCHVIVSLGFLVTLCITLPMGYFNLDDNMIIQ